jgi:hypothetical protein
MYYKHKKEDCKQMLTNKLSEEYNKLISGLNSFMERSNRFKMIIDWLLNLLAYRLWVLIPHIEFQVV